MAGDNALPATVPGEAPPRKGPGRPTKYSRDLCTQLPEMFAQGESVAEVCRELRINRQTFYNWVDKYPKFRRAYEEGQFISEAWWIQTGRIGAAGLRNVQPALWIFNMKNRFAWRDRPDPEGGRETDLTPEEFARRAHAALADMEELDDAGPSAFAEFTDVEVDAPHNTH